MKYLESSLNKEYFAKLTQIIFESTGLRVAFRDVNNNPLYFDNYIENIYHCKFCRLIWGSEFGRKRCDRSDEYGATQSFKTGKPFMYKCHAGLIDIANSIVVDNVKIGTIYTGEILIKKHNKPDVNKIKVLNKDLGLDLNELEKAYYGTNVVTKQKLKSIVELVKFFTDYLIKSEMLIESTKKLYDELKIESELRILLKETKIKEVLSKLNPHFIFNTLNLIPWFIRFKKYNNAMNVVYCLSELLRESFGRDYKDNEIVLKEDITMLEKYLKIQKYRYGNRLNYKFELDKETLGRKLPLMVLQPIVENSIVHGFNKSLPLEITIRSYYENNFIIVEISDTGIGISSENIKKIFDFKDDEKIILDEKISSLKNINKLLKLKYGEDNGLNIRAIENEGTKVIIRIPK